jgi:hypothetical protein
MPRFIVPSDSMPFGSPSIAPPLEAASAVPSSVRLSCSSPGGRAVHSLSSTSSGAYYIETHSLPLAGTAETNHLNHVEKSPSIIRTRLPEKLRSALSRYPAIELLCVDVQSFPTTSERTNKYEKALARLPSLCLYTKKDVFLLDINYEATSAAEVEGVVSNISEPYEEFLIGNAAINILRIRQAPQKFNGYATLCPVGAMSMLTQNPSTIEYCLCVYHGNGGRPPSSTVSTTSMNLTSHHFRMEDLADPNERIADFCFCQSIELPLLSSLTVAFLKVSGEVLFATPIVFHGTIVPSQTVTKTLDFLDSSLDELDPDTATSRQFRTAKQFLIDAFPSNGRTNFVTAGQITGTNRGTRSKPLSEVFHWPVQMQGPILYGDNNNDDYPAMMSAESIEPFATEGDLVGLSIGHLATMVDFAVVSPSSFVPRFKFESSNDAYDLDQGLTIGHIVNRVDLGSSNSTGEGTSVAKSITLLPDPMMDDVVHYMTPNQIISISTNTTRIASNKVRENSSTNSVGRGGERLIFSPPSRRSDLPPKTKSWKCLDASFFRGGHNPIVGAVISDDVQLGHTLVARLSDGNMIAINLTETRHLCELENFSVPEQVLAIQDARTAAFSNAESQALTAIDQTEALSDTVQPLMQDVLKGLGALAQVGGTATSQEDVSPDVLAGFIGIETKCKKEIFLPLLTMNEHVNARKAEFKAENVRRKQQMGALKEMIACLREKQNFIKEKTEIMLQNSKCLADRSTSVLQSSKDLFPTITQAEYDYFQELKRLDDKTKTWESNVQILSRKISSFNDSTVVTNSDPMTLSPQYLQNAGQLLNASGLLLNKYQRSLALAGDDLDGLASVTGFARDANQ